MKKIVSGNSVTIIDDAGIPHTYQLHPESNNYLKNILMGCENEDVLKKVVHSKAYENFIRLNNKLPKKGSHLFSSGYEVMYVACDRSNNVILKKNRDEKVTLLDGKFKLKDIVLLELAYNDEEKAKEKYVHLCNKEPELIYKICSTQKIFYAKKDLVNNSVTILNKEKSYYV